jgi:putative lipoprotein
MQLNFAVLGALTALFALAQPAVAAPITLSGQVTYHEHIALPAEATLGVRLVDLTRQDARSPVHAQALLHNPGAVPLDFSLRFDDSVIVPSHHYALVAEISADSRTLFRNTAQYDVDPRNPQLPIVIVVNFIGTLVNAPAPAAKPREAPILETRWRVQDLAGKPLGAPGHATLTIGSDMRAGGRGGCNSYFAQAQLNGPDLAFSAVAATRIACSDPTTMADENAYFSALGTVRSFLIEGTSLHLLDKDGHEAIGLLKDNSGVFGR